MSDSIRVISSSAHCDTVQVYDHQVIVKRVKGGFECECSVVSEIGNVPCNQPHVCYHIKDAINLIFKQRDVQVDWFESEDSAWWEWGTRLLTYKWTVTSKTGKAYIVATKRSRVVTLVLP